MNIKPSYEELESGAEKLKKERDVLSLIVDNTPHGIALLDKQGN